MHNGLTAVMAKNTPIWGRYNPGGLFYHNICRKPDFLGDWTIPNGLIEGRILSITTRGKMVRDLDEKWPDLSKFHLHESSTMVLFGAEAH